MENIDPLLILQPIIFIVMSVVAILYWRKRRGFRRILLLLSLVAYAVAIGAKVAIQAVTYTAVSDYFGTMSVGVGLYFGLQTVFLEVGLAYLVASFAQKRVNMNASDGVAYGISLGFWENAVLLGALSLVNLIADYALIASGSSLGQLVYNALLNANPAYFSPPSVILPYVLIGTLERLSSLLVHVAFGTLCVLAVLTRRRRFLAYAMPMGLVDAFVPFASLNLYVFEGGLFLLSLGFIAVAWVSMRSAGTMMASPGQPIPESAPAAPPQPAQP